MAWSNPRTWVNAEIVTQTMLNSDVRDNMRWASGARGTSLPGSPNDGDEYYYVADATLGVVWRLKYNSGSASSFKWEFVGGSPMTATVVTREASGASGSWMNLATDGPSVTIPRAGDYLVRAQSSADASTDMNVWIGIGVADFAGATWNAIGSAAAGNYYHSLFLEYVLPGLSASNVVKLRYFKDISADCFFSVRHISVTPVRVI